MIANNAMQLKAFVKNKAKNNKISAQAVLQNYMMERLLERISISQYRNNFIVKGGFLISSIVGLDTRTTMDLDTTVRGVELSSEVILRIFAKICKIHVEDNVTFEISGAEEIRETDDYPGIRLSLNGIFQTIRVPLKVDITTGDVITPGAVEHSFQLLFQDKEINMLAYNLETILAEKIETVLSRGTINTRPRDFYDIHVLYSLRKEKFSPDVFRLALKKTGDKRGSSNVISRYNDIVPNILASEQMRSFWKIYQRDFSYANEISFDDVLNTINEIMDTFEKP